MSIIFQVRSLLLLLTGVGAVPAGTSGVEVSEEREVDPPEAGVATVADELDGFSDEIYVGQKRQSPSLDHQ